MNLKGKRYTNISGKTCVVKESNQYSTIFEDGNKVDTSTLLNPLYFTEMPKITNNMQTNLEAIDPDDFFDQGRRSLLAIANNPIPLSQKPIDDVNISVMNTLQDVDKSYEIEAIIKRNAHLFNNGNADAAREQINRFNNNSKTSSLLNDDGYIAPQLSQHQSQPVDILPPLYTDRVLDNRIAPQLTYTQETKVEDPIITMFKRTKMNTDFKVTLEINNKIPKLSLIELMEDSYDVSMIEFLADEFTNNIIKNPSIVKDQIIDKLKNMLEEHTGKNNE